MLDLLALFRESIVGALVIAAVGSLLGVYMLLRRVVFVGAALAQLSSAGLALAAFLASAGVALGVLTDRYLLALLFTVVGVAFLARQDHRRGIPADARLGMAFVLAGGAAILLVARSATADLHDLFFGGDVLLMNRGELARLGLVGGAVLALHLGAMKEFVFVSFDPEMAATLGYRVRRWSLLLYLSAAALITVAIASAGVLLTFAYLVLPPISGLLLGKRLGAVFAWSVAAGVTGTLLGFLASIRLDLPTGATVIVALGALALAARLATRFR